jgi:polyphosphate kinase 2 (PPK2 family)
VRRYRVTNGKDFTLAKWDPADTSAFAGGKADARAELAKMTAHLDDLQEKFYADNRHKRVHPHAPASGQVAIFDRSHYEDVLIVRVHDLVPPKRWRARYTHIRNFERMLADEGTTILKFFLHISKDEQAERLRARLDDPTKHWKFRVGDLDERKRWDDYQDAYEEAIRRTTATHAPWIVVPANRKWYRDLVICQTLIDTLERLDLRYPEPVDDLSGIVVE